MFNPKMSAKSCETQIHHFPVVETTISRRKMPISPWPKGHNGRCEEDFQQSGRAILFPW